MAIAAVITIVSAVQYLARFFSVLSGRDREASESADPARSGADRCGGPSSSRGRRGSWEERCCAGSIADGREVRALARSDVSADGLAELGAVVVRGDLFDHEALSAGHARLRHRVPRRRE